MDKCDSCRQGDDWLAKMTAVADDDGPWDTIWRQARHAHKLCEGCVCGFCKFWNASDRHA